LNSRSLREALAAALEVAPGELTGAHELMSAQGMGEAHTAVIALRVALADNALDDPAEDLSRPWPDLAATLQRVNCELRRAADYAVMGLMLPDLITDLHAAAISDPGHRRKALGCLLDVYTAATFTAKHLGESDLAALAAMHARAVAAELGSPAHTALAELLRAQAVSTPARARSLALASRAADRVAPLVGIDEGATEMYGMLHLTCALNAAALRRPVESVDHQAETAGIAARVGGGTNFGHHAWETESSPRRPSSIIQKVDQARRDTHGTAGADAPTGRAGHRSRVRDRCGLRPPDHGG
jgi:hypothetical protein